MVRARMPVLEARIGKALICRVLRLDGGYEMLLKDPIVIEGDKTLTITVSGPLVFSGFNVRAAEYVEEER